MIEPDSISPGQALEQLAAALPHDVREDLIICGSLAAAYWFFAGDGNRAIRTKDIDGLCSPHAKAVATATAITEQLLDARWKPREDPRFAPGKPGDAPDGLPMVRLHPPEGSNWFLELMAAPPRYQRGSPRPRSCRQSTPPTAPMPCAASTSWHWPNGDRTRQRRASGSPARR